MDKSVVSPFLTHGVSKQRMLIVYSHHLVEHYIITVPTGIKITYVRNVYLTRVQMSRDQLFGKLQIMTSMDI